MARTVHSTILTAMQQGTFSPIILVEMYFDSGNLFLWNGLGETTIDSITYTGAGDLLSISEAEETSQVVSRGMGISLSGVPASMISLALSEPSQGRKCVVKWSGDGLTNTSILFLGKIDKMDIEEGTDTAVVAVTVENDLAMLERVVSLLYSDQSQKSRYPTDEAFSHVVELGDQELQWGGA